MNPLKIGLPCIAACLLALAACSSPPQPPTVDEANRRPANATLAVELQVCRSALHNTRILAAENARLAEASGYTVTRLVQQQALAQAVAQPVAQTAAAASAASTAAADPAANPSASPDAPAANTVLVLRFAFGSAQLVMSPVQSRQLVELARTAPLIVLRGRTDGSSDSVADSRIARQRAEAVRAWLLQAGIEPGRIRSTWQPFGDPVADNSNSAGRALNRRVEIEFYRVLPQPVADTPAV